MVMRKVIVNLGHCLSEKVLVEWLMKGQAPLPQMNMGRAALTNRTTGISMVP